MITHQKEKNMTHVAKGIQDGKKIKKDIDTGGV